MGWILWMAMAGADEPKDDPNLLSYWRGNGIEIIVRSLDVERAIEVAEETIEVAPARPSKNLPRGTPGNVAILLPDSPPYISSIELNCKKDGYRARAALFENQAAFTNVPNDKCTIRFKGGGITNRVDIRDAGIGVLLACKPLNNSTIGCQRAKPE